MRILETALSSHSRPSFCNAGHSPTGAAYWILSGASQASRAADEVIEYGTRTSDIVKVFGRRSFNGHDVVPFVVGFGAHNGIA